MDAPLYKESSSNGLFELTTDYVHRKFMVLLDLTECVFSLHQGAMPTTVWAKRRAVEAMSASHRVPNVGWHQVFLLLCTIPTGWKPGAPTDAATMQSVAISRQ